MGLFRTPPKQGSLPKKRIQITEHQKFIEPTMGRVMKNDSYFTQGKIEVVFINRTQPVPIWVLDTGASPKPEVGDYVLVGYIDGQKNNPYMAGLIAHHAWTSNFIRVEKGFIRIQFPTDPNDVNQGNEVDPSSHLRNDAKYLNSRGYIQIDASGIKLHVPSGTPVTVAADTVNVGNGALEPVARQGDSVSVNVNGTAYSGTITGGSGTLKSS